LFPAHGGLQQAEAHLVGRAFAPEHVARLQQVPVHERLPHLRVVELAADANRVADVRVDGVFEVVSVLPVEVPARDVQQRLSVQLDPDVEAARVHVACHAVDPERPSDAPVATRAQ